ncbi:polysaccharide deacetylase family sporulation protein PdaB [Terribacillus saccharophilus]|uniref:Polysaccharide deacetylase family sporulation protein PdaB n=1 Tax=Terribacillus saccharophilus TaxID=361277 RepID=A0AAX2EDV5_9BACI|nr:polysaccharide deacetylase family sporulation protein PdaB [Terribacillus saccharophilus]
MKLAYLSKSVIMSITVVILLGFQHGQLNKEEYEKSGEITWEVQTKKKVIALTFDDGPNGTYTNQVLDVLKENNAKATFFVIGENVKRDSRTLIRTHTEGHEIGNHTFTHTKLQNIDLISVEKEIKQTDDIVMKYIAQKPLYFRPVGGYYNEEIVKAAVDTNHKIILWSQDTRDWNHESADHIYKQVMDNIHPGDIILLHDGGGDRTETVQAIKRLIPALKKKGYALLTISELKNLANDKSPS